MSMLPALRRLLIALSAAGSLVPGAGLNATAPGPPPARPSVGATSAGGAVDVVDLTGLRRTWSWPLAPRPAMLAPFVAPRSTYGSGHRGIDLAGSQGQAVRAVDAGVVTHVGVIAGRGTVTVTHVSGLRSTYEPVAGAVSTGDAVAEGQVIGSILGRSHCGGSCLHLGALVVAAYVDPRPLLGAGPVILLPLSGGAVTSVPRERAQPSVGQGF